MNPSNRENHWNKAYSARPADQLGWYELKPKTSLELIQSCNLSLDDPILDVGIGSSNLFEYLLRKGYNNLWGMDVSEVALNSLRSSLGEKEASRVNLIHGDITSDEWIKDMDEIALWHDRALLHFLVDERDRQAYVHGLKRLVRAGGFVILATFARGRAKKCSGLDVRNYDDAMMQALLGKDFSLIQSSPFIYTMPSGDLRPYLYALFKRTRST